MQTLALPKTLAGLTQTNPAELKSLVDNLVVQLKDTMPGATAVGAGFYRDSKAAQKLVMVMQVKGSFPAPSLQVEAMFGGLGTSGVKVTDLRDVDFGSLGIGRCGKATLSSVPVTVCGWGDDDGLVQPMKIFIKRSCHGGGRALSAGETYDLPEEVALQLVRMGRATAVHRRQHLQAGNGAREIHLSLPVIPKLPLAMSLARRVIGQKRGK